MSDSSPQTPPEGPTESSPDAPEIAPDEGVETEIEVPVDPEAQAADRAGFKFLAVGFLFFFVIIAVCASAVALVMKNMGI